MASMARVVVGRLFIYNFLIDFDKKLLWAWFKSNASPSAFLIGFYRT